MKILLTGATGFLGSSLAKALSKPEISLVLLKRSHSNTERIQEILPDVTAYDTDLCPLETVFEKEGRFDVIIHTATCYGKKKESCLELFESNIHFPLKILELARHQSGCFINTDTFSPKAGSLYALSKSQFHEWGKALSTSSFRFINVRLEHLYGPRDNPLKFSMQLVQQLKAGSPFFELTSGEQTRDFIYIDDAVEAYLLLLHSLHKTDLETFSLGTGKETSLRTFVELVHRSMSASTELRFGALPHSPHELMRSNADLKAFSSIGWEPKVSLEEGIRRTIDV